ncbi:MAG: ribbon-helix-helix protein, CopG family [Sulfurimonas sp.]|nr:ribbon-helix-helix protein, CopG family [Sulfurimonas sp.]
MTVRKNFLFDDDIAEHLKEIAQRENTTQSQVIRDLIEDKYEEISVEEKLEAFYAFAGSGTGLYGDLTIQEIKANMDV